MAWAAPDWMDRVLRAFDGLRGSGPRWRATCPAHEDRSPSLSIWIGRNGALLLGCHAGCPKAEVLAKVGLTMRDLYPPKDDGPRGTPSRRLVATYSYRDEMGRELYQALRFEPKTFRYRRKGDGGEWIWDLGDVRRVLYLLPELLARPAQPVVIVEGEGKAARLHSLGFCATCNVGGAQGSLGEGAKWADSYSETLTGRRCVILPDNDGPGLRHAYYVAGSLLVYQAASVRVVELPGLPPKGDVVDWLKMGGTREELVRIVRAAPEWVPRLVAR